MATPEALFRALLRIPSRLSRRESWRNAWLKLRIGCVDAERPRRYPLRVQIEATSQCNLRCPTCPHARTATESRHLDEASLRTLLDRLPRLPDRVILSGVGEPLINPRFFSLVDLLAGRGILCEFYTNGTLLRKDVRHGILQRPNIDRIGISCDGATKATFEALRVGADFDRWKLCVGKFLAEARQAGGLTVGVNVVVSKGNLGELGNIFELALGLGFDHIVLLDTIPSDDSTASLGLSEDQLSAIRRADYARAAAVRGVPVQFCFRMAGAPPQSLPRCLQPWQSLFVRADGGVEPCAGLFGPDKMPVMGNLLEQDFAAIWHGEPYRAFRRQSARGINPLCRICPYY